MRLLAACTFSALCVAGCGHGSSGPTAPGTATNVAGTWSGTLTKTVTSGPACLSRQPLTLPATAQIMQSGAAISGTLTRGQVPCSFHGTVGDTTISWTQDTQQASFACLLAFFVPCFDQGGIHLIDIGGDMINIAGTISGSQITASGVDTSNIIDPTTGHPTGAVQAAVGLTLQRQ